MRYIEIDIPVQEDDEHEHGAEYTIEELARELQAWLKKENIKRASLHVLWSDFPLRRHLTTSRKWATVLLTGEKLQLWYLGEGRQSGSKIVYLSKKERDDDKDKAENS